MPSLGRGVGVGGRRCRISGHVRRLALAAVCLARARLRRRRVGARPARREAAAERPRTTGAARAALIASADLQPGWTARHELGARDVVPHLPGLPAGLLEVHRHRQGRGRVQGRLGSTWSSPPSEVYASHAQAIGGLPARARSRRCASCLAQHVREAADWRPHASTSRPSARKQVAAPRMGERSARYKIVLRFTGPGGIGARSTSTPSCSRRAGRSRCS